jgi:hypothetical protein
LNEFSSPGATRTRAACALIAGPLLARWLQLAEGASEAGAEALSHRRRETLLAREQASGLEQARAGLGEFSLLLRDPRALLLDSERRQQGGDPVQQPLREVHLAACGELWFLKPAWEPLGNAVRPIRP